MDYTIDFGGSPTRAEIKTSGLAELTGWTRFHLELLADPRFSPGMAILLDHSDLDASSLTNEEVREIGRIVNSFRERVGSGRRAIVASGPLLYGLSRMAQAEIDEFEEQFRVFMSREEAEDWLQKHGSFG